MVQLETLLARDDEDLETYKKRLESRVRVFNDPNYKKITDIVDRECIEKLYQFSPDLIAVTFAKEHLPFWHPAVTVIDESGFAFIEMQKSFESTRVFLGYGIEEVLAHEALHVFRADLSGDRFEEILAYQSSNSSFRRRLGPIFRFMWEPWLFFLTLIPPFLSLWGMLFPVLFFLWRGVILQRDMKIFQRALKQTRSLGALVRMTEEEIILFGTKENKVLKQFIQKQNSLRWQQIKKFIIAR
ncbi:MAG: hypothetical protein FJZ56_00425 [Chlamydiae bacterium]|nr:hypothetical protein [Chlamydiota bacterium]